MTTTPKTVLEDHYELLIHESQQAMRESLSGPNLAAHAESHAFVKDIEAWILALGDRAEVKILESAVKEYQFGLFALTLGQYRHAFAALRLFLELCIAAAYYSSNELLLREWLQGRRDNNWKRMSSGPTGVFTERFANAFAPELREETKEYGTIARKVYRECSEFVHGNWVRSNVVPSQIRFDQHLFTLFHQKGSAIKLVISFALTMRFLTDFSQRELGIVEQAVRDQIGHLTYVRNRFTSAAIET